MQTHLEKTNTEFRPIGEWGHGPELVLIVPFDCLELSCGFLYGPVSGLQLLCQVHLYSSH